jgi:hypothetical protein
LFLDVGNETLWKLLLSVHGDDGLATLIEGFQVRSCLRSELYAMFRQPPL